MNEKIRKIFEPKSIAIFGASPKPGKIGYVILRNLLDGKYQGGIYPINPKYDEVFGIKCYKNISEVKGGVDCAIVATPAETVPQIVKECGRKKVGGMVVLTGGFEEVGRTDLAEQLKKYALQYDIPVIGPNCLGIYNPYNRVDSIFFPMYKLGRPNPGGASFITQSGAVGSVIIDLAANYKIGVSKFISYGNATVLDETDLLEFLANDSKTTVIVLYLEGVKKGRKLLETMKRINKKKPILALKAGRGEQGKQAAVSHTGNLAGNYLAYKAAFRQARVLEAADVEELFNLMRIFTQPLAKGERVAIITNGGGLGVLATDAVEKEGLLISEFNNKTKEELKKILPPYANIRNPLDLIADATVDMYEKAIDLFMVDENVDILVVSVLFQSPSIDERLLHVLTKASDDQKKPIIVVSMGGEYTEVYRKILESKGVPTFSSPSAAIRTLKKFVEYSNYMVALGAKKD
ncbi:MAG: CoA-binding protein [Candidatus Micrarchaeota archaeon]